MQFIKARTSWAGIAAMVLAACGGTSTGESAPPGAASLATVVTNANPSGSTLSLNPSPAAAATSRPIPVLPIPLPLVGVTLDTTANLAASITSLQSMSKVATTRIVFDEFVAASTYRDAASRIRAVSYVMGEILDSQYVRLYSVQAYLNRTSEYLAALGSMVDIWEVGNEINGEWLGNNADVVAKMSGAYDLVKAQSKTAGLTLYYNKDCWSRPANEMFAWAQNNIPIRMKQGLDYVLLSYYEDDCNGLQPDWPQVFQQLHLMFPNSRIGFGEVGTTNKAKKAAYITRYYGKQIDVPNYAGGYFWWYFKKDMVPSTQPLLATLNLAINSVPAATPPPPPPPAPPPVVTPGAIPLTSASWSTQYDGFGSVSYDALAGIVMSPKVSRAPAETHAALTLANNVILRNFKLSITAVTEQQLRLNSAPNPWESFWIFFNYNPVLNGKNTNYFVLKTNGVELGTAYERLGQTFLQTGPTIFPALGASNKFDIEKTGNHVSVSINGQKVSDFTGAIIDVPGSFGLYTEDARVRVSSVQITPLP